MLDAERDFWLVILGAALLLAFVQLWSNWRRDFQHSGLTSSDDEQELVTCTLRLEAARKIVATLLDGTTSAGDRRPRIRIALQTCAGTTQDLFRRLSLPGRLIVDADDAQVAADAWILSDLGLAEIRQRAPGEMQLSLSPIARALLERERQEACDARRQPDRIACDGHDRRSEPGEDRAPPNAVRPSR